LRLLVAVQVVSMWGGPVILVVQPEDKRIHWLWSMVYKGLAIRLFGREIWLGWTTREFKRRGW
jgi:hypothetical protein